MGIDLTEVQNHVWRIVSAAPGGRVLLSRLGAELRQVLPDFSAIAYGFPTLKALLQAGGMPGQLVQRGPLEWWFVAEGGSEPPRSSPINDGDSGGAPMNVRPSLSGHLRIDSAWFKAITEFNESRNAWFDLQEEALCTDETSVTAEPERFLQIPRFDLQRQSDLARTWCEEQPSPVKEELMAALDAGPKLAGFLKVAEQASLVTKWSERRLAEISSELLQWAKNHAIDSRVFLDTRPPVFTTGNPTSAGFTQANPRLSPQGMSVDELRHFLRRVIEDMTGPELAQIPIPARFLLKS